MLVGNFSVWFVIFIKRCLKIYVSFKTNFKNNYHKHLYNFKNYNCAIVNSYDDVVKFKEKTQNISKKCLELDEINLNGITDRGKISGWCSCCNKKTNFIWQRLSRFSDNILFTETLYCQECKMKNRIRAIIHLFKIFENSNPQNKRIYCYERNTIFFDYLNSCYGKNNEIIGSEYFGSDKKPGEIINNIRHEDCMNLSFKDNELDYIFSNDVFEHVPDIEKTLSEVLRCLKKEGKLILHIPLELHREHTLKRAEIKNGEVIFNAPKEYHGGFSFKDPNGCLVFYNYGQDIFDIIKNAGFSKAYGIAIQDEKFVNIGIEPLIVFICEK